tara:strand:- start:203 stop:754 length:552 start_codon:yes stop_codon:yes gene_type:complete
MAITINGTTNTIGGLAVGGVPDGTIDTDALAAGAVTADKRGTDGILEIVSGTTTTELESTSTSYVDTGLTATITTTGSNKVLVLVNQVIRAHYQGSGAASSSMKLLRDSTGIVEIGYVPTVRAQFNSGYLGGGDSAAIVYLDSPGSGGTYVYKVQAKRASDGDQFYCQYDSGRSNIILMEIAA